MLWDLATLSAVADLYSLTSVAALTARLSRHGVAMATIRRTRTRCGTLSMLEVEGLLKPYEYVPFGGVLGFYLSVLRGNPIDLFFR